MTTPIITIDNMLRCAERELALRKRVYERHVQAGKMAQATAEHEIACMQAIVEHLRALLQPVLFPV